MKKYIIGLLLVVVIFGIYYIDKKSVVENTPIGEVPVTSPLTTDLVPSLGETFSSSTMGFSITYPKSYKLNTSHVYQASPKKIFSGISLTVPASTTNGTNLSKDSYISFETLDKGVECSAPSFFDGVHDEISIIDEKITYSMSSSSGAGAGNRYDETVYVVKNTVPCLGVRYYIHHTAIQNYPTGTVKEFDKESLIKEFDQIRHTLILNQ